MSFRLKTILGIAFIEGILLLLLVWSGLNYLNDSNRAALSSEAKSRAKLFVSLAKDAVLSTDLATLNEAVDEILSQSGTKYIRIKSQGEVLIERGDTLALARPFEADSDLEMVEDGIYDISENIVIAGQKFGLIELGISTLEIDKLLADAEKQLYIIAAIEMILVALFSFVLGSYLTQMLSRLKTGVDSISKGEHGTQIEVYGKDELADTAAAFNTMSHQLLKSHQEMERRISESKALSVRLKQSELRTRTILNTAVDGFVIINEHGIIQDINTSGANTFGYQVNQVVGQNVSILMPQPYRGEHDSYLQNFLAGGEAKVIGIGREVTGMRQDGSTFPMDLSVSEMVLGNERMFVGLVRDISEKRALEAISQRNEALKSAIFDSSLDALVTVDIDDSIIEFSAVAEDIFDYRREDVIGKNMCNLIIPPEFREAHKHGMAHYLKTGEGAVLNKRIELTAMRRSGEVFPVEVTISPIEVSGVQLFTAFLRDITDLKQSESKLSQALTKAEAASEAKSRFLAHMSHEIRSPLNAVLGSLDLLRDSSLNYEQFSYTRIAQSSGKALLGVINDVLDFSKIEAGEMELKENNFSTRDLIEGVLEIIDYRANDKLVDVASTMGQDLPAILYGDTTRIRQVLINLMDNAIKFTKQGSVVLTVSTKHRVDGETLIRFCVEDTGQGIPEELQEKLFDEFSQADNSDSTSLGGTGLGLAICKQLVILMQGEIGVDSEAGLGSRFWFELPLIRSDIDMTPVITRQFNKRLLIVGLSRLARNAISFQAEMLGCHCETTSNGRDALRSIADTINNPYDYVLVDESIADIELALFIKRVKSESGLHLILIPANNNMLNNDYAVKQGFEDILRRPFHIGNLLSIITGRNSIPLNSKMQLQESKTDNAQRSTILLAEDSKANQIVARSVLEKHGYAVEIANDGQEAITCYQQGGHDLILMDLRMPNKTGLEATKAIRNLSNGNNVPIIAMTANALQSDIDRCMESGMNDYVSKPFDREHLLKTIEHWINKSSTQADSIEINNVSDELESELPIVNDAIFKHLANDTSPELVPQMVEMFLTECQSRLEIFNDKIHEIPLSKIRDQIHTIKSLAGTFGTPRLEALANKMEQACIDDNDNMVHELAGSIVRLYEETASLYQKQFETYMVELNEGNNIE